VTQDRKRGRRPKPAAEKLTECVRIWLTQAEADDLYRRAIRAGDDLSPFLRSLIFEGREKERRSTAPTEALP
jgi:hypothetical protein